MSQRTECQSKTAAEASHGKPDGLDQALHTFRRSVVSVLRPRGAAKDLGKLTSDVNWDLEEHANVVGNFIVGGGTSKGMIVAWSSAVDEVLDHRCIGHCYRQDSKADSDTGHGAEVDSMACEERVETFLDKGSDDYTCKGACGFHHVVGNAIGDHLTGLGDQVVERLVEA